MMSDLNPILFLLTMALLSAVACVWWSPKLAHWLAGHLIARAAALQESRQVYRAVYDQWRPRRREAGEGELLEREEGVVA